MTEITSDIKLAVKNCENIDELIRSIFISVQLTAITIVCLVFSLISNMLFLNDLSFIFNYIITCGIILITIIFLLLVFSLIALIYFATHYK